NADERRRLTHKLWCGKSIRAADGAPMAGSSNGELNVLLNKPVVLDTAGPVLFLGRLLSAREDGFWLEEADVHHSDDGHATREQYIAEAARYGIRPNRQRVFVFRHTVISISALSDIMND